MLQLGAINKNFLVVGSNSKHVDRFETAAKTIAEFKRWLRVRLLKTDVDVADRELEVVEHFVGEAVDQSFLLL